MAAITITDVIKDASGDFPTGGVLSFVLSGFMVNTAGKIIVPTNETCNVSAVDGSFSITLESTTDCTPGTRTYAVTFTGTLDGQTVTVALGSIGLNPSPGSQDLSDLVSGGFTPGSVTNIATLSLTGNEPRITIYEGDQGADLKFWDIDLNGAVLNFRTRTDADGAGVTWLSVVRGSTTSIDSIQFPTSTVIMDKLVVKDATSKQGDFYVGSDLPSIVFDAAVSFNAAATLTFKRSEGTMSARTNVANGDFVGVVQFDAMSGGNEFIQAFMQAVIDGTFTSAQAPPMRLEFYTGKANTGPGKRVEFDAKGNVTLQCGGALSTSATDGFTYLPTCAGTPTGVPTTKTGAVAWVYDTTNNKIYVYNGAWKATAALT